MTLSLIIGKGRVSFGVWGVLCFSGIRSILGFSIEFFFFPGG